MIHTHKLKLDNNIYILMLTKGMCNISTSEEKFQLKVWGQQMVNWLTLWTVDDSSQLNIGFYVHAAWREFLWLIGQIIACDKRCLYLTPSFGVNQWKQNEPVNCELQSSASKKQETPLFRVVQNKFWYIEPLKCRSPV